MLTEKLW